MVNYKISPLHLACQSGHVDVVKILLQRKASVDFRSLDGRNALDFAIDFGQKECALMLVQHETWMKSMKNATVDPVTGNNKKLFCYLTFSRPVKMLFKPWPA